MGAIIALSLAVIAIHCIVVAAPGFFSHDEGQQFNDVAQHEWSSYGWRHMRIHSGRDFGTPIHPIGFLEEGFGASGMETRPFVPHLIDVRLHTGIALLLFLAQRILTCTGRMYLKTKRRPIYLLRKIHEFRNGS